MICDIFWLTNVSNGIHIQIDIQDWSGDNWQELMWYQSKYNICSAVEHGCFQEGETAFFYKVNC